MKYRDFSEMPPDDLQEFCRALDEIARKAAEKAAHPPSISKVAVGRRRK